MYINPSSRPLVSLTPRITRRLSSCELLLCQVPPLLPRTILPPLSSSTSPPHAHCQYLDQLSTLTTAISLADCDICVLIVLKLIFYEAAICSTKVCYSNLQILLIDCHILMKVSLLSIVFPSTFSLSQSSQGVQYILYSRAFPR